MSFTKVLLSVGAFTALLAVAPGARAATCQTDADCGKGFACQLLNITEPTPAPCAPDTVCANDAPAVDAGTKATTGECIEAPCKADTDCGAGMVCHTETSEACSGGSACPPNTFCFAPPPTCTTTTVSTCMYKWQLPCNVAADCGDGFTCQPMISGSCSGGSGTASGGTVSGGAASASAGTSGTTAPAAGQGVGGAGGSGGASTPADTCTTTMSFPGYCAPKATSCTVDADCPTAWTCTDAYPLRGGPVAADAGTATPIASGSTGSAPTGAASIAPGEPDPTGGQTTPSTKVCTSPFGGGYGVAGDSKGTPETLTGGHAGAGGATNGATGGSTGTTSGGATPPTAPGASGGSPSAGCAVGGGAGGSALAAALALLALVVSRRRR